MGKIVNLEKINSLKRQYVRQGMEYIDRMNAVEPVIDRIVVFGSAITDDCTEESDVDLCIFSDYDESNDTYYEARGNLMHEIGDVCDILNFSYIGDDLKRTIEKGVTVYER